MIHAVYALMDPETRAVRYVGQSIRARKRFNDHLNVRGPRTGATPWIAELRSRGLRPLLDILQECATAEEANEAEATWAQYFMERGHSLLNKTLITCPHCRRPVFVNIQALRPVGAHIPRK